MEEVIQKIRQTASDNKRLRSFMLEVADLLDEMDSGKADYSLMQIAYELRTTANLGHEFD